MAGEGDAERLVVLLEARIRDFERNMQRASGTARRSFDEITAGSSRSARTMSKNMADAAAKVNASVSGFAKGFVGGLAAGAIAEVTTAIRGAVSSVAELKAQSQQAGLGVEQFQKLGVAATQAKVGTDALVDGLKEMQLRIDEFIQTGSGSAAESLQRLGYDADTLKVKLKNPSDLFLELIGRIKQLDRAAQIRVLDELFGGTGGEQFIRLVDLGADKVRRIGDEAKEAGRIIDSELVERAALLDAQWELIATTIRTKLVEATLIAANSMTPLIQQTNALGESLNAFIANPNLKNFNRFMFGSLAADPGTPGGRGNQFGPRDTPAPPPAPEIPVWAQRANEDRTNRPRSGDYVPPPVPQNDLPPIPYKPPNLLDYDPNTGRSGAPRAASRAGVAEAARTERDAVEELISSLESELSLVGKSDAERKVANNLRQAGAEATDAQKAKIAELTKSLTAQEEAYKRNQAAAEAMNGVAKDAISTIISDLRQGKSAAEAFTDALDKIADKTLDIGLNSVLGTGKGGGGGLLTGLITSFLGAPAAGGVFADGGYTGDGGKYQPAGIVHRGEVVWSKADVQRAGGVGVVEGMRRGARGYADGGAVMPIGRGQGSAAGGSRGSSTKIAFSPVTNIDARGSQMTETQFLEILRQNNQHLLKQVSREVLPKYDANRWRSG